MEYSVSQWLIKRNPVIVKFIETLTQNDYNSNNFSQEKLFKRVIAVDAIYGSRHERYVSEINLVASAVKYSLACSKKIINIDNHITNAGSYTYFQNWLDKLANKKEAFPNGLVFLAFDNEQKGQKNYLDRGSNTVIFHTVTSFVGFNYDYNNNIQNNIDPWLYSELNEKQYEELFDFTLDMKNEIHKELIEYLTIILEELCNEKNQKTNIINELIHQQSKTGYIKKCHVCQTSDIDNKKQVCPKCHTKLLTISEINQQLEKPNEITDTIKKSLVIHSYISEESNKQTLEKEIHISELFIPDPIGINPNSIANIQKVLKHIEEISGIKNGDRKWIVVICDGVPYHHIQKIKKKFPWLILIPGSLHEEMNMLKSFVELNWDIDIKNFAQYQGYRNENQLRFFKKCIDHHKSWDSICNIYRHAMASELIWPYVNSEEKPTVEGYLK